MTAIAAQPAPQWINDLMDTLGAPGAGLAVALENLFPPLPSEVILPLAGFASSTGQMNLYAALLWTTAGSVVGALALYGVGALLGLDRTLAMAARLPLVKVADVEKTEAWFNRHGTKAVFFGRMIPVFRSLISVPAGVERMRLPVFLGLTALGSAIWNTVFVLAGYLLGERWTEVTTLVSTYSKVVLVAAAVAVVAFVVLRLLRPGGGARRRGRRADAPASDAHTGAEHDSGRTADAHADADRHSGRTTHAYPGTDRHSGRTTHAYPGTDRHSGRTTHAYPGTDRHSGRTTHAYPGTDGGSGEGATRARVRSGR